MPDRPRLRHLVVVIPGIGGSVLDGGWGGNLPGLLRAMAQPSRLSVSEHPTLTPKALMPSLTVLGWTVVHGYDGLVREIQKAFTRIRVDISGPGRDPDLAADLVLFPYDFRLGVPHAAEQLKADLDTRLADLATAARRQRIIVVAHSLGGLVARYWLGPLEGAPNCRALITLGTPHKGSPKALDQLVNGVGAGPLRLPGTAALLGEWPSMYDLLPCYPAVLPASSAGPAESIKEALHPHQLADVEGLSVSEAKRSYDMHQAITESWRSMTDSGTAPDMAAVYGRGHATPARAVLDGRRVRVVKAPIPGWLPDADWLGDGTVPANTAIPLDLDDRRLAWRRTPERHQPMAEAATMVELLEHYAGASRNAMRGREPRTRPWLGMDLDDLIPAGDPIQVTVTLHAAEPDAATNVWVTVLDPGRTPVVEPRRMEYAGDGWSARLPALPPGAYDIRVQAVGVPVVDRIHCHDGIGVVEP